MRTIFRPHHDGGLIGEISVNGEVCPVVVTWGNGAVALTVPHHVEDRQQRAQQVLGWVLAQIGSHTVEFSQALVPASPCLSPKDATTQAQAPHEAAAPLLASDTAAPPAEAAPTQAVVEGVVLTPAPEKPTRSRSRKAVHAPDAQRAQEATPAAAETPAASAPAAAQAPVPAGDPSAFTELMADASAQQERLRSPAEPRFREPAAPVTPVTSAQGQAPAVEEYRVEPEPDPIDKLVDLLAQPPMPPDLCPVVWLRGAADHRYADTALTRLVFQRCLEPEYAQAGAQPHQPIMPPRDQMLVDVDTQTGVVALVNLLFAVDERATARGMEIPQLAVWLSMYREADGLRAACENAWQRIEGLRQQAAQRRAAQQAQARPVASAPAYGAPAAHGAHPSYVAPQQPAYQQPAPAAAGSGQAYYGHPQGAPSGTGHYSR